MPPVEPARVLFDLLIGHFLDPSIDLPLDLTDEPLLTHPHRGAARSYADKVSALHLPVAFPEVFLRPQRGFDCILGNPPWDKVMYEPQQFWVTREPGLNALSDTRRERRITELRAERPIDALIEDQERADREQLQVLVEATYDRLGRGHYDFAKLFVERANSVLGHSGTIGFVLPRQALVLSGWSRLREDLFSTRPGTTLQARNAGGWLFEDIHHSYMVVLLTRSGHPSDEGVTIWPSVASVAELRGSDDSTGLQLSRQDLAALTDTWVVPWFNTRQDAEPFDIMRTRPSLSSGGGWMLGTHDARWDFRGSGPHRAYATPTPDDHSWSILMTRHVVPFALATDIAFQKYVDDPGRLVPLGLGVEDADNGVRLGRLHPLVIVRHPSRNDDSRTLIAAALPERGYIHNKGYVHAVRHTQDATDEHLLALLGYINSYVCDWWARRFVDRHITAPVLNNLPLPDWTAEVIGEVAGATSALLARRGSDRLAGGRVVQDSIPDRSDTELLALITARAAQGFGLTHPAVAAMLEDFSESEAACSEAQREAIREAMR
jgi:hypothetical protein